ncbi:MAG: hypothetical protein AB7L66_15590 [Gemmatimonadales bacterium]
MSEDRSGWWMVPATFAGLGLLFAHVVMSLKMGEGYAIPTTLIGIIGATVALRGPVGQAIARRLQGPAPSELPPEQLLNELDELRGRIMELEERADFSERLLASQREGERLPGG